MTITRQYDSNPHLAVCAVEKGNLADSDGSKDSSLESNEFRSYGRNDGTFLKEVKRDVDVLPLLLPLRLCAFVVT